MFTLNEIFTVDNAIHCFGHSFDLLKKFKDTVQDKEWHSEGDVHIHTDMVLSEAYAIIKNEAKHLSDYDKEILIWSALLHDICKPISTKEFERDGKIRIGASRHEMMGRDYLFYRLREFVSDEYQFTQIINLVGLHNIPKLLVVKDDTLKKDYFKLARQVRVDLIYYLELADIRGRICSDFNDQIDTLEMFKLFCQDYNLWDNNDIYSKEKSYIFDELRDFDEKTKNFVFNSFCQNFENGIIYTPEEEISRSYNYRNSYSHLVVTCGISGSGKSTFIQENFSDYNLISLDSIRKELLGNVKNYKHERKVRDHAKQILKTLLAKKENIVWDSTNYRKDFRAVPLDLGFNYKAFNEIILFNQSLSSTIEQNKKRTENLVDETYILKQSDRFQVPTIDESHCISMIFK